MQPEPQFAERLIHLLLFVFGAVTVGVVALALVERLADGRRRVIRPAHVLLAGGLTLVAFAVEWAYHAL